MHVLTNINIGVGDRKSSSAAVWVIAISMDVSKQVLNQRYCQVTRFGDGVLT